MKQLRDFFERFVKISDHDWQRFAPMLIRRAYPKKATLLAAGQTEEYISFVEKGVIRFYLPNHGEGATFAFIFENELVSAYDSFLKQTPSLYTAQTLDQTVLWSISYQSLHELYNIVPVANIIGRMACEELYLKKAGRELSLLNDSAETRYLKIFSERPNLLARIPLKYIASYIGITPQALSRIRRQIC